MKTGKSLSVLCVGDQRLVSTGMTCLLQDLPNSDVQILVSISSSPEVSSASCLQAHDGYWSNTNLKKHMTSYHLPPS
jgi:hypothetical protein